MPRLYRLDCGSTATFDNFMVQIMINNRTEVRQTEVNLLIWYQPNRNAAQIAVIICTIFQTLISALTRVCKK